MTSRCGSGGHLSCVETARDNLSATGADRRQIANPLALANFHDDGTAESEDEFAATDDDPEDDTPIIGQPPNLDEAPEPTEILPAPEPSSPSNPISVTDVAESIHSTFPLLEAAYQENQIAAGKQLAAWGGFDTKLKGASENGPVGFYETYRHRAGLSQPIYRGGEVFGGYRIGRGEFQPWYLERQTNEGGEFKAGVSVPLLRNRRIDARRAELWRATYDRQRAEPEIRAQLILFVRDGSIAYWQWIAAGRKYEIGKQALELAERRNAGLKREVDEGETDPPVLQDNLRAIAQRQAKLIDLQRKLQQAAIKLSLFLRSPDGMPLVPEESSIGDFPQPSEISDSQVDGDVVVALSQRPELAVLDALARRVDVDLAEARNDMLPTVDAQIVGSQDVGAPTSSKRDKSPFELEAGVFVELPVQRRKARGKMLAARAKLTQLAAKRRFTEDKIKAEIQAAYAALTAAFNRLVQARESKRLAIYMAEVEQTKFEKGGEDLLSVVLREQQAIEAAQAEVDALLEYHSAKADYNAAMARDWPE